MQPREAVPNKRRPFPFSTRHQMRCYATWQWKSSQNLGQKEGFLKFKSLQLHCNGRRVHVRVQSINRYISRCSFQRRDYCIELCWKAKGQLRQAKYGISFLASLLTFHIIRYLYLFSGMLMTQSKFTLVTCNMKNNVIFFVLFERKTVYGIQEQSS